MSKCNQCGAPVSLAPDGDPKYDKPRTQAQPEVVSVDELMAGWSNDAKHNSVFCWLAGWQISQRY